MPKDEDRRYMSEPERWNIIDRLYDSDHFVVLSKQGTCAGRRKPAPQDVRDAFKAYWTAKQEGKAAAEEEALVEACAKHDIPVFGSWHQFEEKTGIPMRSTWEVQEAFSQAQYGHGPGAAQYNDANDPPSR